MNKAGHPGMWGGPSGLRATPWSPCTRGGALLAVLWLSAALSAIAFSVATTVRGEVERSATAADSVQAYFLARGAIDRALLWVFWGQEHRNPDGSARYWARPLCRSRFFRIAPTRPRN